MNLLLIGNFGAGNYGDEAILIAFLQQAMRHFPHAIFHVVTANRDISRLFLKPFFDEKQMQRIEFVDPLPFGIRSGLRFLRRWRKILTVYRKIDAGIYCGGGLFTDEESRKSIPMWASYAFVLRRHKKPVIGFGLGVGDIRGRLGRRLAKWALDSMDFIGVRDKKSIRFTKDLGVNKEAIFTGDTCFLLEMPKSVIGVSTKKPYVTFSFRPWKNHSENLYKEIAQTIDYIIEHLGFNVGFLSFQKYRQNDDQILNKILEQSRQKEHIFYTPWGTDLPGIFRIIVNAEFHLGMRLHSNIFSMLSQTPFLLIPYGHKGVAFLNDHGISNWKVDFHAFTDRTKYFGFLSDFALKITENKARISHLTPHIRKTVLDGFNLLAKAIAKIS